jgi:hypothetical protein
MSTLRAGDEELHYGDSSHRWLNPYRGGDDDAWEQRVRAHLDQHRNLQDHARATRPVTRTGEQGSNRS